MDNNTLEKSDDGAKLPERSAERSRQVAADPAADAGARLPLRIDGGFAGLTDELDRRARDWRNQVYLLEQQRPQLEAAEAAYAASLDHLASVAPALQERNQSLMKALRAAKAGDLSAGLGDQFSGALKSLEDLETLAEQLTAQLLWVRSCWEQYARSVLRGHKMREELTRTK